MKKIIPIVLLLMNCASTGVKIKMYSPAQHVLWGIKNITIADVYGDFAMKDRIQTQIETQLRNIAFFNFFDSGEIQSNLQGAGFTDSDLGDISKIEEVAKALNIDGLIYLKIDSCEVFPDIKGSEKIQKIIWTGKYQRDEQDKIIEEEIEGELVRKKLLEEKLIEQKYTIRRGVVSMEFILADGQSGNLALVRRITKHYDSGQIPDEQIKNLPSESDILSDLSEQAITEFIDMIKPRLTEIRRPVKDGAGFVEEGRIYALDNLWHEAIDSWFKAVQMSPNDAGIHYNLGLAYEALGQYSKAEEYYRRAQLIQEDNLYQNALDHIAEHRDKKKKKLIELLEKYPPANYLKQKEIEDTEQQKGSNQSE